MPPPTNLVQLKVFTGVQYLKAGKSVGDGRGTDAKIRNVIDECGSQIVSRGEFDWDKLVGVRQCTERSSRPRDLRYRENRVPAQTGTVFHGYDKPKPVPVPGNTRDPILTVLPIPLSHLTSRNDREMKDETGPKRWAPGKFFVFIFSNQLTNFYF